jgi:outer membrane protein OmpA-like peptidoglycan-associated protein
MRFASDEREHRRGLVLGLTMAEVLLLLLFLLLLALAARLVSQAKEIAKAEDTIRTLTPLIETIKSGNQITPEIVQTLAHDLASVPQLRHENDALKAALADAVKRTDAFKALEARAREINPNDPPAALTRGLDLLANQGDARIADLQARSVALTRLENAARAVDPAASPQTTIESALSSMQAARKVGADAKMGGQIREQVAVLRDTEQKINQRLNAAFGTKLAGWGAELDPGNLTLRFQKEGVLFDQGSPVPSNEFKRILREMFPAYIRILRDFQGDLEEVRIEGHTSSEWAGKSNPMEAYFLNMGLSQERTRAVLEYGLTETELSPELRAWARELITANGLSSSRLRESNGIEDKDASRRVEFRVLTRAKEQLLKIVDPGAP